MNARRKTARLSSTESTVQAIASRNASKQLLRVPWSRFQKAYEGYPRWHALALWGEAIIQSAGCAPRPVLTAFAEHCPGFVQAKDNWEKSPALHLLEWVHANQFAYAKQEGWLDALIFYGVRHPTSRATWTYLENCEEQWSRSRPASLPSFDRWRRMARRAPLPEGPGCALISQAVEGLMEWKAFMFWLQPLFFGADGLPPEALSELESRCPELADLKKRNAMRRATSRSGLWRHITGICRDRALARARREGWAGILLEQARSHPLYVRRHAYAALRRREWSRHPVSAYPSLAEWKQAAAEYIHSGPASRSAGWRSRAASFPIS